MTTFYAIYYGSVRPHSLRERRFDEIFNESILMTLNYHLIGFTGFNMKSDASYIVGYSLIAFTGLIAFVNLGTLAYKQVRNYRLKRAILKKNMELDAVRKSIEKIEKNPQFDDDKVKYYNQYNKFNPLMLKAKQQVINFHGNGKQILPDLVSEDIPSPSSRSQSSSNISVNNKHDAT